MRKIQAIKELAEQGDVEPSLLIPFLPFYQWFTIVCYDIE